MTKHEEPFSFIYHHRNANLNHIIASPHVHQVSIITKKKKKEKKKFWWQSIANKTLIFGRSVIVSATLKNCLAVSAGAENVCTLFDSTALSDKCPT